MILLFVFAFLGGIFTVLSPCILPILPVLLSAGTVKGKYRPLGIIVGLIISFTFFTLSLTAIVHASGISANVFRWIAISLIFAFGLVMLFPSLSNWFAKISTPFANYGQKYQGKGSSTGFKGGFFFGLALGLIWTPCAGPILAAISALVATQAITKLVFLLTLTYSIGAAIPMFLLAYGSQYFIEKSRILSTHAERIRQFFGIVMIFTAIAIACHWDVVLQQKVASFFPSYIIENNELVKEELNKLYSYEPAGDKAPEIMGISNWINSPPLSLMQLRGKVVLVDFWTYSCINCLRTLPYLTEWDKKYRDKGLVIIGVHTPEFEFEKDPGNVMDAVKRLGVQYPVAQDNDYKTWGIFRNHYWPAHYLIDQQGNIVMTHFGEGKYVETENAIRHLLGLEPLAMEEPKRSSRPLTPEIYLGTARGKGEVNLTGSWKKESERVVAVSDDCTIVGDFLASNIYLVLSGKSNSPVEVYLDDKFNNKFMVDGPRKYDIAKTTYGEHKVIIKIPKGIEAYAFTFGDEE